MTVFSKIYFTLPLIPTQEDAEIDQGSEHSSLEDLDESVNSLATDSTDGNIGILKDHSLYSKEYHIICIVSNEQRV